MTARSIAAVVLGFTLAVALCGLYVVLGPVDAQTDLIVALLSLIPIWVTASLLAFVVSSVRRACVWLLAANAIVYVALWVVVPGFAGLQ